MNRSIRSSFIFVLGALVPGVLNAAPFASSVIHSGTNVSFILNEPADSLSYSINGGLQVALNGSTKGTKTFSLGSPSDTFSILVGKTDAVGYTIPTGGSAAAISNGLSVATNQSGFRLISDDSNPLTRYLSPRGVSVSNNPNAPTFGTAYISNSRAGSTTGVIRAVGDGMYAIRADQTDAFGYGNTAQDPGGKFDGLGNSDNSPYRTFVAPNGEVYVTDFSAPNANIWRMNSTMTTDDQTLAVVGGPVTLPPSSTHGRTAAVYVEGSSAAGDLVVYTLDADLTTSVATGSGSTTDKYSLWRYDINNASLPFTGAPTKVNLTNELTSSANVIDLDRGIDGKFYLGQNRSAGGEPGIVVLDAAGSKLFDSLSASRTLLGNPSAVDIYRNVLGLAVSPDQKWLAVVLNNSDVSVIPLVNGIPDLANRLIIDTGTDVISGRDAAFDAAGNLHYISSGQQLYRVLSPGGTTWATTAWNGSSFSFQVAVPEPAGCMLLTLGLLLSSSVRCMRRGHSEKLTSNLTVHL